ncbi:hypothetical protein ACQKKX_13305 [Neorhizobium sp. NPDC001467]|uniref:hypothetical protein n=1 Tax=Neorhizobium sp. NPDC001467 TaxID=3390595 RepID=UPI003CFF3CB9
MTIIARRMTILALIMCVFALSFSALVTHQGRNSMTRLNAQALCGPSQACSVSL